MKRNKFNVAHAIFTLLALVLLGVLGCKKDYDIVSEKETQPRHKIIYIDNCQYITMGTTNSGFMAHKGNCNNPIHIYYNN
jgi:uncharacterized lipoprotein NlpE involved in copper resistance